MTDSPLNHKNLKAFKQHGFIAQGLSGDSHVYGRCPFCGTDKHFYINFETKKWDCKGEGCGAKGGYQTFLRKIIRMSRDNFTGNKLEMLSELRGLSKRTLRHHKIGYNPLNKTFLIPILDVNGEEIFDVKIYKKASSGKYKGKYKDLFSTSGCKLALYGWEELEKNKECTDIWLVEGHWDKMAMWEILYDLDLLDKGHIPVGAPGADSFKVDWLGFFKGKNVHIIYDNDHTKIKNDGTVLIGAGFRGTHKVQNYLEGIAKSDDYLHWPRFYSDGFDLSDYYVKKKRKNTLRTFKGLNSMLKKEPQEPEIPEGIDIELPWESDKPKLKPFSGTNIKLDELYAGYRKWLELKDLSIIDLTFGSVIANRLSGHPLWILIVGPSSCGKSELITSLDKSPRIHPISSLTTKTLISGKIGEGGHDPSLAARIDQQILTIKDLTVLLSKPEKEREEIFGQFRDLWDGTAQKPYGTGVEKVYEVKFGFLAGVTEAIELYMEKNTALGERYVRAPFVVDRSILGERAVLWKAFANSRKRDKDKMQKELQPIACRALDRDYGKEPGVPDEIVSKLMALSQWIARMRATVERDKYSYTRDITHLPFRESPTRIFESLLKWMYGIVLFRKKEEADYSDYCLMRDVALASAPRRQELIVRKAYKSSFRKKDGFTEGDFSHMTGLPTPTCKILSDALTIIGIFEKNSVRHGFGYNIVLSDECLSLIEEAELYPKRKDKK